MSDLSLFVRDGLRHIRQTGYGALSRHLILGLDALGVRVTLQEVKRDWDPVEPGAREVIEALPTTSERRLDGIDFVLQIGTPAACAEVGRPSLIYTQNGLSELRDEWVEALRRADGVIVPSRFDEAVFSRHFERVYVARQSSDAAVFKPVPSWRSEGSDRFTFLFVGSYSYRKGVDLLLEAFLREFSPDEPVELSLQCAAAEPRNEFNHLLEQMQRLNPGANIRFSVAPLTPDWMCRLYNRCDCLVTLSRGEGWCMPVTEALLCGLPVIAPLSTGMAEYLSEEVAFTLPVAELQVAEISEPFGQAFARTYGEPGIACYEPDLDAARAAMRRAYEEPKEGRRRAEAGRRMMLDSLTWEHAAREVEAACRAELERGSATAG